MGSLRRLLRLTGVALVAASATSCESGTGGEFETWAFMVYGVITDARGAPVPGVAVEYELYRPTCDDGTPSGGNNTGAVSSDAEGYYRRQVLVLHPSPEQCLV